MNTAIDPLDHEHTSDDGFSLVEIIVVIVILGILAAVAVLGVSGVTHDGNKAACVTDVRTIQTAADAYFARNAQGAANLQVLLTAGLLQGPDPKIGTSNFTRTTDAYVVTFTPANPAASGPGTTAGVLGGSEQCQ